MTVLAASSLRDAVTEIAAGYEEARPGSRVRLSFGASNVLSRQIREGAPADLFIAADEHSMNEVEREGLLVPGSRRALLSNSLAILVAGEAAASVRVPEDLLSAGIMRVAVCDEAVPVGRYARAWLDRRGLLAPLAGRIVEPSDARAALALVESGAVDAAVVYETDARGAIRSRLALRIPPGESPGIVYPAAVLRAGPNPATAQDLLGFLESDPAREAFRRAGFTTIGAR